SGDSGRTDPVAAHDDRLLLAGLVEIRGAEGDGVFGAQLEDVADLDHPFHGERLAALRACFARLYRVKIHEPRLEIPARDDAAEMDPLAVGADDVRPTLQGLVGQDRHAGTDGSDRAHGGAQRTAHLVGMRRSELLPESAGELALVDRVVTPDEDEHRPRGHHVHERLDREPWIDLQEVGDLGDRPRVRRRHLFAASGREHGGGRHAPGQLDVGGVVAADAERDLVLAGGARRHELVGAEPTHHARVGLNHVKAKSTALEDLAVRRLVRRVRTVESGQVGIERVGVFHQELTRAQHPGARSRRVAFLRMDVIPDLRQAGVGADLWGGQPGDDLFVRHAQAHVGALAVLELEHLGDVVPAPRLLPDLGGVHHGHGDLLPADRVHLFPDDRVDLVEDALAEGKVDVDAGRELPHESGPQHELVAQRLRLGRLLPQGGNEGLAEPHPALVGTGLLVRALHTGLVAQPLDGLASDDVGLEDLLEVGGLHARIPDVVGIDDHHRAVTALRKAAGLVDADVLFEPGFESLAAELFDELLDVTLGRARLATGTDEHVCAVLAHALLRRRRLSGFALGQELVHFLAHGPDDLRLRD